jgi:hypothetical protein
MRSIPVFRSTKPLLLLGLCGVMTACMVVRKPSDTELHALDHPPVAVVDKLNRFYPLTLVWYEEVERQLLSQGRTLTSSEKSLAQRLGVKSPESVRIVVLEKFPMPSNHELATEAEKFGLGGALEGGRTMGYVIILKPHLANHPTVIAHELVHVAQHDRLGREAFLRRYLTELEMMGYARAPLELEAYAKQSAR